MTMLEWIQLQASAATYLAFLLTLWSWFLVRQQDPASLTRLMRWVLVGYGCHVGMLVLLDTTFVHLYPTWDVWPFWRRVVARNMLCVVQCGWWVMLWLGRTPRDAAKHPERAPAARPVASSPTTLLARLEAVERAIQTLHPPTPMGP